MSHLFHLTATEIQYTAGYISIYISHIIYLKMMFTLRVFFY